MEEIEVTDGVTSLVFRKNKEVPDDGVINIVGEELPLQAI
jgi:hypothetical protein